jgi:hypothetical protein
LVLPDTGYHYRLTMSDLRQLVHYVLGQNLIAGANVERRVFGPKSVDSLKPVNPDAAVDMWH